MGQVDSPPVEVVDTTGAGDAFVGALLAELCTLGYAAPRWHELTVDHLEQTLKFACAAGAIACTKAGAMPSLPDRASIQSLLEAQ